MDDTQDLGPGNAIALASAGIGLVSGIASGSVGYSHAKSAYEAASGSTAGFSDYITVGIAFWDGLPIAIAIAFMVAVMTYGAWGPGTFGLAGVIAVVGLAVASQVSPAHLDAYERTVIGGNTTSLLSQWGTIYGPLASFLALIAGAGVGFAVGIMAKNSN